MCNFSSSLKRLLCKTNTDIDVRSDELGKLFCGNLTLFPADRVADEFQNREIAQAKISRSC